MSAELKQLATTLNLREVQDIDYMKYFKEFQLAHYTQRLVECPHFFVDSNGELQHNTECLSFLRQQLFNLKKP